MFMILLIVVALTVKFIIKLRFPSHVSSTTAVVDLGPVYTMPVSYEIGMEVFRFGLPSTLNRFPIWQHMRTTA